MAAELKVIGIAGVPEVATGDDLGALILEAAVSQQIPIADGDVLVVTQKVVSKAEGCVVRLSDVEPSPFAIQLSEETHRDPRHTEVILRESVRIVRMDRGNIISETRHGFNCANAGVDASNVPGEDTVATLPLDPDASARRIRAAIQAGHSKNVAVIISDTFGRPWREGAVNVAIGVAGMSTMKDYRGQVDVSGRPMYSTVIAVADELAAVAELVTGKVDRVPAALIKGYAYDVPGGAESAAGARTLIRSPERDLFR